MQEYLLMITFSTTLNAEFKVSSAKHWNLFGLEIFFGD